MRRGQVLSLGQNPTGALLVLNYLFAHLVFALFFLPSGSYLLMSDHIRMSEAECVIASVTSWYEKNMQRPVESKTKPDEEQQLARSWRALLKRKSKLPADVRAEAEKLKARLETKPGQTVAGPIDRLVEWMEEHKRRPRYHRDGEEGKFAQLWMRYSKDASSLPSDAQ